MRNRQIASALSLSPLHSCSKPRGYVAVKVEFLLVAADVSWHADLNDMHGADPFDVCISARLKDN